MPQCSISCSNGVHAAATRADWSRAAMRKEDIRELRRFELGVVKGWRKVRADGFYS
jgi:hypothetical protein